MPIRREYWSKIELIYDDEVVNHIAKHNVSIRQVLHVLRHSKKIAIKLKSDHYAIIGESYGRCLVIIITRVKKNKFLLRTARDCSEKEKKRYRKFKK